jgi:DNA (cytosine-5)-methyltransferase 1
MRQRDGRPRLLDLFCGAGGATKGYQRAGFYVVGVDVKLQPNYCGDEFHQADALEFPLEGFGAVHASPPCQAFSRAGRLRDAQGARSSAAELVAPIRERLIATGLPYVIENVEGAPVDGIILCGSAFGLKVRRHRIFESNVLVLSPPCTHKFQGKPVGVYHRMGDSVPHGGTTAATLGEGQEAMGIDWMPWDELKEAIPPAYTEWIGRHLMTVIEQAAA